MKYMLMMHAPANAPKGAGVESWKPEEVQKMMQFMKDLNADLSKAGELASAEGLDYPPRPRIVRADAKAKPLVTDGPFAEVKEYLGGLTIVAAPDLDAALEWGRKAARATTLPIEVRPFDWA